MRGLQSEDLLAIIDFLYYGKVNVFQENLDTFLSLAEELKLKGLTGTANSRSNATESTFEAEPNYENAQVKTEKALKGNTPSDNRAVAITNNKVSAEVEDLDDQIKSMMTMTDVRSADGKGFIASCNICGRQLPSRNMPQHIEANHITGVSHSCDLCGKSSRSRNALRFHKYSNHRSLPRD